MNEFDMIAKYFAPLSPRGLDNDAAVLEIPAGRELVVSSDTLNAGVHFMADAAAGDIAHKALRVNLSDLAAMGAAPFCYQLNIAFSSKPSEEWLEEFTGALLADQKEFGVFCSGGDTTSIDGGALSISITAMGLVEKGTAWSRSGAQEGDQVVVVGTIGDAWIGLQILRGELKTENDAYFVQAYYRPVPQFILHNAKSPGKRTSLVSGLVSGGAAGASGLDSGGASGLDSGGVPRNGFDGMAVHAAIDVSDGLVADLGHICKASAIGAQVELEKILFSPQAQKLLDFGQVSAEQLLTGGDDYALLLAVSPEHTIEGAQIIGAFGAGHAVVISDKKGKNMRLKHTGWSHF